MAVSATIFSFVLGSCRKWRFHGAEGIRRDGRAVSSGLMVRPLLALPQVMVTLHPLTVVCMAWNWAVTSSSAVTVMGFSPPQAAGGYPRR
jgi:hypothetical protein